MNVPSLQNVLSIPVLRRLQWEAWAVFFLLGLGVLHIPLQIGSQLDWSSPVSFRKPILFGISTGLTLGSLLLLLDDLVPGRRDQQIRIGLCVSLVLEVLLITLQSWRRVPSHFNRTTIWDAAIELGMLVCILFAVALIMVLTLRTMSPRAFRNGSGARILAQQTGMVLLAVSCLLGVCITIIGHYQLLSGGSTEIVGRSGVLKFPHGAVLHAIQTLVAWSWLCDRLRAIYGRLSVSLVAGAHAAFLIYAARQTWLGRSRWDCDALAWGWLTGTMLLGVLAVVVAIRRRG